jgi:hypothetical protein
MYLSTDVGDSHLLVVVSMKCRKTLNVIVRVPLISKMKGSQYSNTTFSYLLISQMPKLRVPECHHEGEQISGFYSTSI